MNRIINEGFNKYFKEAAENQTDDAIVNCDWCQEEITGDEIHETEVGTLCDYCFDEFNTDWVKCNWCDEYYPKSECKYEVNLEWLCNRCAEAIWSRGEKPVFITKYDESLNEENELEKKAKWHKKHSKGMPYGYKPNAGNVEYNVNFFNHAMGNDAKSTAADAAGSTDAGAGDAGTACCGESLEEDTNKNNESKPPKTAADLFKELIKDKEFEKYYFDYLKADRSGNIDDADEIIYTEDLEEDVKLTEDYGWNISSNKAWDAYDEVLEILGAEELCKSLAKAIGNESLANNLAYICRMNDLKINALDD